MDLKIIIAVSDQLLKLAGSLPNIRWGITAVSVTLGRLCAVAGIELESAMKFARMGKEEEDLEKVLSAFVDEDTGS